MPKGVIQVLGMIFIPSATEHLLSCFFDDPVVQDKEDHAVGLNLKSLGKSLQGNLQNLLHSLAIFPRKRANQISSVIG